MGPDPSRDVTRRICVTPQALRDLEGLAAYLGEQTQSLDTAMRCLAAAESAFDLLARTPLMGSVRRFTSTTLTDIRLWRISGFEKHLVFYRPTPEGIAVIRVLHSARDVSVLFEEDES